MSDTYANLHIPGLSGGRAIVSSELFLDGTVQWDLDPEAEFLIDDAERASARYQTVEALAAQLKQRYPIDNTLSPEETQQREETIIRALADAIHEEYGEYNQAIAKGKDSSTHSTMHSDHNRAHTPNHPDGIAKLSEFSKDTLICRHFTPIMAIMAHKAGVPTLSMSGYLETYDIQEDGKIESIESPTARGNAGHVFLISRLTGNVIESSGTNSRNAYKYNLNKVGVDEALAGVPILTTHAGTMRVNSYASGYSGTQQEDALIQERLAHIQTQNFGALSYYPVDHSNAQPYHHARQATDQRLIEQLAQHVILPARIALDNAIKNENFAEIEALFEQYPYGAAGAHQMLLAGLDTHNLEMVRAALKKDALNQYTPRPHLREFMVANWINGSHGKSSADFIHTLIKELQPDFNIDAFLIFTHGKSQSDNALRPSSLMAGLKILAEQPAISVQTKEILEGLLAESGSENAFYLLDDGTQFNAHKAITDFLDTAIIDHSISGGAVDFASLQKPPKQKEKFNFSLPEGTLMPLIAFAGSALLSLFSGAKLLGSVLFGAIAAGATYFLNRTLSNTGNASSATNSQPPPNNSNASTLQLDVHEVALGNTLNALSDDISLVEGEAAILSPSTILPHLQVASTAEPTISHD